MKTFTDTTGRSWAITINVDTVKRVRGLVDVDLLGIADGTLIEKLYRDPILLCDVVYAVCKPEADERNLSDEEFGRAMAGDAIDNATKVLLEELVDFSPSPRDRAVLQRVLEASQQAMERARDVVEARLDSGVLERIIEQALKSATDSSGDAPESSASTPDG